VAANLADVLNVSLDFLAGKAAMDIDQALLDKVLTIQQLPDESRAHILPLMASFNTFRQGWLTRNSKAQPCGWA
jgi:hypothetical protein